MVPGERLPGKALSQKKMVLESSVLKLMEDHGNQGRNQDDLRRLIPNTSRQQMNNDLDFVMAGFLFEWEHNSDNG